MLFTIIADAQTITLSVLPAADAFVVASAPTNNYGAAGASSVSGVAGTNSDGQLNGVADSLARFPMSNLVSAVDAALGTHDWLVTRSILHLYEMGTPPHPIFSRGVGRFEILPGASGHAVIINEREDFRADGGHGAGGDFRANPACTTHRGKMTEQSEAGDIDRSAYKSGFSENGADRVQAKYKRPLCAPRHPILGSNRRVE